MNSPKLSDSRLISQVKYLPKAASAISMIIGCLVLVGWILDIPTLKSILPGFATMRANTAFAFILSGVSLWLLQKPQADHLRYRIGQLCAFIVGAIGCLRFSHYIFQWHLDIGRLLFSSLPETLGTSALNQMAPNTALNFILISLALMLLGEKTRKRYWVAQLLTLTAAFVALLALIGYAYEVKSLYQIPLYAGMALHTALTFSILCLGILLLYPEQGLMKIVMSNSIAGFIARRLLLAAIAIPSIAGFLVVQGYRAGFYTTEFGISLLVIVNIIIFVVWIWQNSQTLERLDHRRQKVEEELQETFSTLENLIQASPLAIIIIDTDAKLKLWSPAAESIFGWKAQEVLGHSIPFVPENKQQELLRWHQRKLKRNSLKGIEAHYQKKDGSPIDIAIWGAPLTDSKGNINSTMAIIADITERKQTEEALRSSDERFRQLADNIQDVFWIVDRTQQQLLYVSPAYEQIWGRSCESLLANSMGWIETIHPEDRDRLQATFLDKMIQGEFDEEYRIVRPDGSVRWIRDRGFPIKTVRNTVYRVAGIAEDITERKQAASALTESEARFRKFFEEAPIGICVVELNGRFIEVNKTYCEMLGYLEEELSQLTFAEITHPEDVDLDLAYAQQLFKGEIPSYQIEKRYIKKNGEILWVNLTATMLSQQDGNTSYALGMVEDISERKCTQEKLQETLATLQALIHSCPLGITVFSLDDGKVKMWNPAAEKIFGWSEQEVLGHFLPSVSEEQQQEFLANLDFVRQGNALTALETRRQKKDGSLIDISIWAAPLRDAQGNVSCMSIVADISDRKRMEEERTRLLASEQAARADAEAANRMKDEFLAILSHELRTPMNAISGWTHLLRTRKFNEATIARALETIDRNSNSLSQLIEDVLDVSRIVRGKLHLNMRPVDLVCVIAAAIDTVRPAATLKEIQIESFCDDAVGLVWGDGNRLQQVIWNLLSNAVKFTPKGGRVEVRVSVVGSKGDGGQGSRSFSEEGDGEQGSLDNSQLPSANSHYIQIQVRDTGKGIKREFLPYVFERFRQENSTTTRSYGGLGLGLAIVRHLVELHGGTVAADSPGEGQGATFSVQLPLVSTLTETSDRFLANSSVEDKVFLDSLSALEGLKVLVVDDEADARDLVVTMLSQYGVEVTAVTSASEGFEAVQHLKPDVLVSDIGMPGEDGYALMRKIRTLDAQQGGNIPAVALTAYARAEDRTNAIAAGFQQHIPKPINPVELAVVVANLAGRRGNI